jgi:hypothetical protein
MYSNNYFNNIRMAHPADQLGTSLYLNRSCNKSTLSNSPGMIFDSKNPQIVDMTTTFGTDKAGIIANYDLRLETKQGQIDELNAVHARDMSELRSLHGIDISVLKAGFNVTISGLREQLAGSEVERMCLEEQLGPFIEERRNSSIISQLKEQDDYGITDATLGVRKSSDFTL